jgi:hypothetical protein
LKRLAAELPERYARDGIRGPAGVRDGDDCATARVEDEPRPRRGIEGGSLRMVLEPEVTDAVAMHRRMRGVEGRAGCHEHLIVDNCRQFVTRSVVGERRGSGVSGEVERSGRVLVHVEA